ncbi:hypothetical protein BDV93DRAFT_514338 [Ceratobasidium sp. AG-I]|nr:hypothetical protein BDV93DRAFT_514338 [Ceratobasidium sp. AG-I]
MSEISVPQTMKAVIVQEFFAILSAALLAKEHWVSRGSRIILNIENIPVPVLEKNEVLIKVNSIALNPSDWNHVDIISPPGNILGSDLSGTVVNLGSDSVTRLKVGDIVSAFVCGENNPDHGPFVKYVQADSVVLFKSQHVGKSLALLSSNYAHATTFDALKVLAASHSKLDSGLAFKLCISAFVCVSHRPTERRGMAFDLRRKQLFAIQLAKSLGYKVVTDVSPKNFELVKSLGADAVVNRHFLQSRILLWRLKVPNNCAPEKSNVKRLTPIPFKEGLETSAGGGLDFRVVWSKSNPLIRLSGSQTGCGRDEEPGSKRVTSVLDP